MAKEIKKETILSEDTGFYASEAYKRLRTNLFFTVPKTGSCPIVGVTSTIHGEGKTTTSINLALALAQDNKKVVLIDGDLRMTQVADRVGVSQTPGLSTLLAGDETAVMKQSPLHENLSVIPAGQVPPNPAELLGSDRLGNMLEVLSHNVDYVIMDLPPVSEVVDALVAAKYLDGLIMVVRRGYATKRGLSSVMRQVEQAGINLLGFVMTYGENFSARFGKYHYGKYGKNRYYYYGYGKKKKEKKEKKS